MPADSESRDNVRPGRNCPPYGDTPNLTESAAAVDVSELSVPRGSIYNLDDECVVQPVPNSVRFAPRRWITRRTQLSAKRRGVTYYARQKKK